MKEKTLLIAGSGYLGKEIAKQASQTGYNITEITLSGKKNTISCDITKINQIKKIPKHSSIIYSASSKRGDFNTYQNIFLQGIANLIECFPKSHIIFTSSTSVYSQTDGSIVSETSQTIPATKRAKILLKAEKLILNHKGTITRLAGLYGPQRSAIIQKFLDKTSILEDKGQRFLNQIHRNDASKAILHLLTLPKEKIQGEIFNISDGNPLSQKECFKELAKIFQFPLPPFGEKRKPTKRAWTHKKVSNEKLLQTGWKPNHPHFLQIAQEIAQSLK